MEPQPPKEVNNASEERGKMHHIFMNLTSPFRNFFYRFKFHFGFIFIISFLILIYNRSVIHPYLVIARKDSLVVVAGLFVLWFFYRQISNGNWKKKIISVVLLVLLFTGVVKYGKGVHQYFSLHYRYRTTQIEVLDEMPLTHHERIQPLNSIHSLADENIHNNDAAMIPRFVRIGEDYNWTILIEPEYFLPRYFGKVSYLFNVPATTPSPMFGADNRVDVNFDAGETLLFSHNIKTCVIRSFGVWRFFNYEPSDVICIKDASGEWVQVVSLIKWKGILCPRPEFGGVQVIRQKQFSFINSLKRMLFGSGVWIRPEDISKHKYLYGQNILPYDVSTYYANSFRFQEGFFSPFPGYHRGDIRIPSLPSDMNEQPFTTYFDSEKVPGKLYHYFALEPFKTDKQGLSTSLLIPADGSLPIYVFQHYKHSGSLIGVSAVPTKVKSSQKVYAWDLNHPAESRPYVKKIDGVTRFFWMTTIVTTKESGEGKFIAGSIPDIVFTDATNSITVWVDPLHPETWVETLRNNLEPQWKRYSEYGIASSGIDDSTGTNVIDATQSLNIEPATQSLN